MLFVLLFRHEYISIHSLMHLQTLSSFIIHSFNHSFNHSFIKSFIHSFNHSFIHSFIHCHLCHPADLTKLNKKKIHSYFIHTSIWFPHPFFGSFLPSFICSLVCVILQMINMDYNQLNKIPFGIFSQSRYVTKLICSFIHSFIHSFINLFIHPSFIRSLVYVILQTINMDYNQINKIPVRHLQSIKIPDQAHLFIHSFLHLSVPLSVPSYRRLTWITTNSTRSPLASSVDQDT